MTFRRRLTLSTALAVAAVVIVASLGTYVLVTDRLRGEVDDDLTRRGEAISRIEASAPGRMPARPERRLPPGVPRPPAARLGGPAGYIQLVRKDGSTRRLPGDRIALPVSRRVAAIAAGRGGAFLTDADVAGSHLRIFTIPLRSGGAVQVARPMDEVDEVLAQLRLLGAAVLVGGVGLALLLGALATRSALAPVERLTEASEHVAETQDLTRRIQASGGDEVARLARSFNTMLDALERSGAALDASLVAQRRLVADASHELRTPLTSIRTNIEVLRTNPDIAEGAKAHLMQAVDEQIQELSTLVSDLIELARGDEPVVETEDVRFDQLVEEVVGRAAGWGAGVSFVTELEPTVVEGTPDRLERAVRNLLDNAAKFSSNPHAEVEVTLKDGLLEVRDHGPGIDDEDRALIFDRFYRAVSARAVPGSGLGLAIVRQIVEAYGGRVWAESAEGGGTRFLLRLPATGLAERPEADIPA